MRLRILCVSAFFLAGLARAAAAQDFVEIWADALHDSGYADVDIERTLLGRIRIVASAPGRQREIVLDRRNGAILRDYLELLPNDGDAARDHNRSGDEDGGDASEGDHGDEQGRREARGEGRGRDGDDN
ncbi:MAG: hypothetical protein H6895_13655 [Defluviimonas sp.]|uniref:hypothetical protein n=1 Tax=Albidovulum sp. TaxID=1872424 RepID=UPI001D4CC921|nr:hypothetical protein [Paracoccaceae bacterium]MCC0065108.1 hypothetical protein [Defluviimonas sp.]